MNPFRSLMNRYESRRRWKIKEPKSFLVTVAPGETLESLYAKCGFTDALDIRIARIFESAPTSAQTEEFELVALCCDPPTPQADAMMRDFRRGRLRGPGVIEKICDKAIEEGRMSTDIRPMTVGVDEAPALMSRLGYVGATARELLSFVSQYPPRLRRPLDVIALGATFEEDDSIGVLEIFDRPRSGRHDLHLHEMKSNIIHFGWMSHHRFLAKRRH